MAESAKNKETVPILNLKEQYKQIGPGLEATVLEILRSGHYILGPYVNRLEKEIAEFCGAKNAVAVANGTDALILALWSLDIGPGDEVITPSFTFAATAEAIMLRGAKPVFVDVDPKTFNIDPVLAEKAITAKTKAIMPVHLYGQAAPMDAILDLAERYKLKIVEDNAQAIGATQNGKSTGTFGDLSCISFYPTKNLGAAGDAGIITTNNDTLAERLRAIRAHGMRTRYYHDELGVNSRLDEIQAAVLLSKLPFLRQWNAQRNTVAQWYDEALKHCPGLTPPTVSPGNTHVWHQYTICVSSGNDVNVNRKFRDELISELAAAGVSSMCYYPVPLHVQKSFSSAGYKEGDLPISEALAAQVISLPMYPELTWNQVNFVSKTLIELLSAKLGPVAQPIHHGSFA